MLVLLSATPYPIDGFEYTGIRRLERARLVAAGEIQGRRIPPGARLSIASIDLRLVGADSLDDTLEPGSSPDLEQAVRRLFNDRPNYAVALLDISPDRPMRAAFHRADERYQPGSVGKLAVVAGLFAEVARLYPDDTEARRTLLKERMVTAGPWVRTNSHAVPVYDLETRAFSSRAVRETDVFSLFEWADHALSASSNAAATVLWKEALLMRAFGPAYPPSPEDEAAFFATTPKAELGAVAISVVNDPLRHAGIDEDAWRLGSLFTRYGENTIAAPGGSWATPRALVTYLLRLEQGRIVDPWSSLQIKLLMYQTERRIRYAASPALDSAAVYFKSGSLYRCQEEAGFECGQYRGNVFNYMNSVATIETQDGHVYMVALMSNVLRVNSASEHLAIATAIDRIVRTYRE